MRRAPRRKNPRHQNAYRVSDEDRADKAPVGSDITAVDLFLSIRVAARTTAARQTATAIIVPTTSPRVTRSSARGSRESMVAILHLAKVAPIGQSGIGLSAIIDPVSVIWVTILVAKRKDAPYRSGGWIKVKTLEWKAANKYRTKLFEKAGSRR